MRPLQDACAPPGALPRPGSATPLRESARSPRPSPLATTSAPARQVGHIMRAAYPGLRYPDYAVGISGASLAKVEGFHLRVYRVRALTPMIVAPASTARCTSSAV